MNNCLSHGAHMLKLRALRALLCPLAASHLVTPPCPFSCRTPLAQKRSASPPSSHDLAGAPSSRSRGPKPEDMLQTTSRAPRHVDCSTLQLIPRNKLRYSGQPCALRLVEILVAPLLQMDLPSTKLATVKGSFMSLHASSNFLWSSPVAFLNSCCA